MFELINISLKKAEFSIERDKVSGRRNHFEGIFDQICNNGRR